MIADQLALSMWAGYRAGPNDAPFKGEVEVTVHGGRPTPAQLAALDTARNHAPRIHEALLNAIVTAYPTMREWQDRPKAIAKGALKDHIQLYELVVTTQERDGEAYLGYVFACDWDPSGFVVLMHRDRIVSVGGLEVLEYPLVDAERAAPQPKAATAQKRRVPEDAVEPPPHTNPATLRAAGKREFSIWLPVWAGFSAGPSAGLSNGEVLVSVGDDSVGPKAVGPEQEAAYRRMLDRAGEMQQIVLDAIVTEYPKLVRTARHRDALPREMSRSALKNLVSLTSAHVQWTHQGGVAYVGYGLACVWDAEHGIGVLTHLDRVVAVGQADTAFLSWVAERDLEKREARRPHAVRKKPGSRKPERKKSAKKSSPKKK